VREAASTFVAQGFGSSSLLQFYLDPAAKAAGSRFYAPREGDAGYDLFCSARCELEPGEQCLVPTGLRMAIPIGWVGLVRDRSSVALRRLRTHAGVIDASYRGEVKVVMSNDSTDCCVIEPGDKIAQMVVVPHLSGALEVSSSSDLGATDRGEAGFGSTGEK
jgi:dUTP pyrophosphatase